VPFQERFSCLLSLLPMLKVRTAIMQVLGRTDLKRMDWAQREASLAPLQMWQVSLTREYFYLYLLHQQAANITG